MLPANLARLLRLPLLISVVVIVIIDDYFDRSAVLLPCDGTLPSAVGEFDNNRRLIVHLRHVCLRAVV